MFFQPKTIDYGIIKTGGGCDVSKKYGKGLQGGL